MYTPRRAGQIVAGEEKPASLNKVDRSLAIVPGIGAVLMAVTDGTISSRAGRAVVEQCPSSGSYPPDVAVN